MLDPFSEEELHLSIATNPNTVFLDTVGLVALWDKSDQWHSGATTAFTQFNARKGRLITTSFVLAECGNAASRKPFRSAVVRMRESLEQAGGVILPTHKDWADAWTEYSKGVAGHAGIVDHISFVIMRRLGIQHAFTNDHHFQAAGFTCLF